MTVSLIGDGIFLVAIAWETYTLWNAPAALSIVGIGMTVPTIAFLLVGGVVSDRYDRRLVMAWADGLRAVAVGALAALIFTGMFQFWQLVAVVAFYGIGTAFFMPAFEAIVPDLLPKPELPAANALDQFVRPIALRLAGPVAGRSFGCSLGRSCVHGGRSVVRRIPRSSACNPQKDAASPRASERPRRRLSKKACGSSAAASGCGEPFSPQRSAISSFSVRRKCCSLTS